MSGDFVKEHSSYLYVGDALVGTGVLHELESSLCHPGGAVYHAISSAEARAIVENNNIVAIVVDQYLPHCTGLDFMRWLHGIVDIPAIVVVMNTSAGDTDTVVVLEAGAADAVHTSISGRELAARIKACTRKYLHAAREPNEGRFAPDSGISKRMPKIPLYFAPECRRLYFSDTSRIVMHAKEAELMTLLITKHPSYIDREEISQAIFHVTWNPNDRRIDNLISKLRKLIDPPNSSSGDSAIETVRNEGYRLRAPIALVSGNGSPNFQRSHAGIMPQRS
jgi:two-component system, OmpR family, response regulator